MLYIKTKYYKINEEIFKNKGKIIRYKSIMWEKTLKKKQINHVREDVKKNKINSIRKEVSKYIREHSKNHIKKENV